MKSLFLKIALVFFSLCKCSTVFGQERAESFWTEISKPFVVQTQNQKSNAYPNKALYFQLNTDRFRTALANTPKRNSLPSKQQSNVIIKFPNQKGELESFRIIEASTMESDFQALFPNIRSFYGQSIENPSSIIRFSISDEKGLSSMVLSDKRTVFIEPYTEDLSTYIVYTRSSNEVRSEFVCETEFIEQNTADFDIEAYRNANDGTLRIFRLALACTGEYAQFHGGTLAGVVAAMNTTMTRVNGVFERDVALTMVMVNNTNIIFFNAATDPYSNGNGGAMLGENQTTCDNNIGFGNYDIGHVFSTGGGGVAYLNSPCQGFKAGGVTGQANPIGDTFDIDFVAHEMGHQYGGNHTQNNNCNRSAVSVEPGSASTIMGYAGICAPDVQGNSDDYFHGENIKEMWANISGGNSSTCPTPSATGNNAPVANAGTNHIIPISTPFVLRGSASDADGTASLTYCWEQVDTTPATMPPVSTSTVGPAFRSVLPKVSPNRFMPDFVTVLTGATANTWEVVPSVSRAMNFSLTVRDNVAGGASTDSDAMIATTTVSAGPFIVTSQGASVTWNVGASELITWNVAGTTANGVNTANVNILMTDDDGVTFITLLANTPNDGSQSITVPNNVTSTARIIVEGVGNIFYNVNAADITIQTSDFVLNFASTTQDVCAPNDAVYNFTYNTFLGFSGTTNFTVSGNPVGTTVTFSPISTSTDGTSVSVTVSGITNAMVGTHTITITGTSGAIVRSVDVTLNVFNSSLNNIVLTSPSFGAIGVLSPYNLSWITDSNASNYDVEIAIDFAFTNIIETQNVLTNTYTAITLAMNTQYFWRVRPNNNCATGNWSQVFNFTTEDIVCTTYNSTDTPLNIPDNDGFGVSSFINVVNVVEVTDINVTVNITHPYDDDVVIRLISPIGTSAFLSFQNGGNGSNYTATVFDDAAAGSIVAGTPPFTGTFQPEENLSIFNSEMSTGNWRLIVYDLANLDTGSLLNWSIEICGVDNCLSTTTWNGATWSNGNPSINKNAILNANYTTSVATPSFEACSLTVNSNNTLTISAGDYIKVQTDLTISANATLEIIHEGSLVMVDDFGVVTNNGTINVHKTTPTYAEYDYTYWSSPVLNETVGNVFAANPSNRIYYFNTANFNDNNNDSFDDEGNDWFVASGAINPGIGIIAMGEGAFTTPIGNLPYPTYTQSVVFSGDVNNGVVTINVDQDNSLTDAFLNQSLLGNPYPSAIDPELFIKVNATALEGTLYFWTHRTFISDLLPGPDGYNFTNSDYNSYNLSGMVASGAGQATPTNYKIASGQGFFADVTDPNIDVIFNNSMRVDTENDIFYRSAQTQIKDRIWLNLTTEGNIFRQTLIAFFDYTTEGYDRLYDAKHLENGINYSLYSFIENEEYVIQARETFNENQEIHLGIETTQSGNLTIGIDNIEGVLSEAATHIYLEDTYLNIIHDLKVSDYTFSVNQEGVFNDRFILRFNTDTLNVENEINPENEILVFEQNDIIHIRTTNRIAISSVVVHDILGRLLINSKHKSSSIKIDATRFKTGTLLFFQIQLENNKTLIKKFIKR
jgi:subtilisin-like proprotein convertase family protein